MRDVLLIFSLLCFATMCMCASVCEHACVLLCFCKLHHRRHCIDQAYLTFQGSIAKKPYNPIIGETFHCSWVLPPDNTSAHHTPDTDTNDLTTGNGDNVGEGEMEEKGDSEDEERRRREEGRLLYYCAEQVSHHPPSKGVVSISV